MKLPGPWRARTGRRAEQVARSYLEKQGLRFRTCNYRSRRGEIDLIMEDRGMVVFVEVRYRSDHRYGTAAESVDAHKQKKLIAAAQHYLQSHPRMAALPCRFDVIALGPANRRSAVEWIRNAIEIT